MKKDQRLFHTHKRCWSKKRYKTFAEADHTRALQRDERLEVYDCDLCGGYHLGHRRITGQQIKERVTGGSR